MRAKGNDTFLQPQLQAMTVAIRDGPHYGIWTGRAMDAPMLPEPLDRIPPDEEIGSVTGDGASDTRKRHDAIAARGAIIPPRENAEPWRPTTAGAVARNEALRASKHLGRALWRRWSGYHRQSRVETKTHCVNRKVRAAKLLGQSLMARDFDRQVAELQVRIAVLNGYTALGIPVTEERGIGPSGERETPTITGFAQQSRLLRRLMAGRRMTLAARAAIGTKTGRTLSCSCDKVAGA